MSNFHRLSGKHFRKATAVAAFVLALSATLPTAAAALPGPGDLRAISYSRANSSTLMVHLDNAAQAQVWVHILDGNHRLVFKKCLGNEAVFVGKFNLAALPNGEYTFVLKAGKAAYSRAISLQTLSSRIMQVK